ncbi:MAG: hypothetical protein ACYS47_16485 [Planctomycetota bacterium]|jgi:hypothetical protein
MSADLQVTLNVSAFGRVGSLLSSGCSLLAVVLFFLPWLEISCSGTVIAKQSGYQAVMGEVSRSEELGDDSAGTSTPESGPEGDIEKDVPLIVFPLAMALAGLVGLVLVAAPNSPLKPLLPLAAVLAAGCLTFYLFRGFSIEKEINRAKAEAKKEAKKDPDESNPFAEVGSQLGSAIAEGMIAAKKTPTFYAAYGLSIVTFLAGLGLATLVPGRPPPRRRKRRRAQRMIDMEAEVEEAGESEREE